MTQTPAILWRSGTNLVATDTVRTRRLTVSLADIDVIEVRRPLLIGAGLFAAATFALAVRFSDVLEAGELVTLTGAGGIALIAGLVVGRVQFHSFSIDGIAITLPIWTAQAMRRAVDDAIAAGKIAPDVAARRLAP